ncbi:MAG: hypothetical protein LBE17_14260, partial [Treponema sp.]|nr:hypothetical protein [Treponema sp.]
MKTAKRVFLAGVGVLAILLAGCFSPITAIPPAAPVSAPRQQGDGGPAPFTVDIRLSLGDDAAEARFLAGPSADQLAGIYNFMELAVLDDKASKTIFTATEAGRDGNGPMPGKMGAGLQSQAIDKSGKVTITMWPLEVDTAFILTAKNNRKGVKEDARVYLRGAGTWTVRWTFAAGTKGDTMKTLLDAKQVVSAGAAAVFEQADLTVRREAAAGTGAVVDLHTVTAPLGDLAVGDEGAVSFNLKYRAFNLSSNNSLKEWIIRNGVNDSAQDANTDFGNPAAWTGGGGKNGNEAVSFAVRDEDLDLASHIPLPATGVTPDSSFAASWYTGVITEWSPELGGGGFEEGRKYTATVTLTAKAGYDFDSTGADAFIYSKGGTVSHGAGAGGSLTAAIAFPAAATIIAGGVPFSDGTGDAVTSIIDTI